MGQDHSPGHTLDRYHPDKSNFAAQPAEDPDAALHSRDLGERTRNLRRDHRDENPAAVPGRDDAEWVRRQIDISDRPCRLVAGGTRTQRGLVSGETCGGRRRQKHHGVNETAHMGLLTRRQSWDPWQLYDNATLFDRRREGVVSPRSPGCEQPQHPPPHTPRHAACRTDMSWVARN